MNDTEQAAIDALRAATIRERNARYQREYRARQQPEVRGIFAHPDDHAAIKAAAAKITRKGSKLRAA